MLAVGSSVYPVHTRTANLVSELNSIFLNKTSVKNRYKEKGGLLRTLPILPRTSNFSHDSSEGLISLDNTNIFCFIARKTLPRMAYKINKQDELILQVEFKFN